MFINAMCRMWNQWNQWNVSPSFSGLCRNRIFPGSSHKPNNLYNYAVLSIRSIQQHQFDRRSDTLGSNMLFCSKPTIEASSLVIVSMTSLHQILYCIIDLCQLSPISQKRRLINVVSEACGESVVEFIELHYIVTLHVPTGILFKTASLFGASES